MNPSGDLPEQWCTQLLSSQTAFYDPDVHSQSQGASAGEASMGTLLTASCTIGWLDWIHGDLWLLPNGLLRTRSGLGATIGHAGRTLPDEPVRREFSPGEIA